VPSKAARSFYEEAAAAAAALGVAVDLFAASSDGCGLDLLEPLAGRSGGIMYLYQHLEAAALPQVESVDCLITWSAFSSLCL
jgi:hypothetical protein